MAYRLYEQRVGLMAAAHYTWVDGDWSAVKHLEDMPRETSIQRRKARMIMASGFPVSTDHFPSRIQVKGKINKVPHFTKAAGGACGVSAALKEIIESVEPGVHIFHPVDVVAKSGAVHGQMFLMVVCNSVLGVHVEETNRVLIKGLTWTPKSLDDSDPDRRQWVGKDRLVFDKRLIKDVHLWSDVSLLLMEGSLLVSDVLGKKLAAANFPTLGLAHIEEA